LAPQIAPGRFGAATVTWRISVELFRIIAAVAITAYLSKLVGMQGFLGRIGIFAFVWAFSPNVVHEVSAQFSAMEIPGELYALLFVGTLAVISVGVARYRAQRDKWLKYVPNTSVKQRLDR
jgi:hypothetical protein